MLHPLLIAIALVCVPIILPAGIYIESISPSNNGSCDGEITIFAEGSAGPFEIVIANFDGEGNDHRLTLPNDMYVLRGLCSRVYSIYVRPTRFPGCISFLQGDVESGSILHGSVQFPNTSKALAAEDKIKLLRGSELVISPNPATDKAILSWGAVSDIASFVISKPGRLLSMKGELIRELPLSFKSTPRTGTEILVLDCSYLPDGMYLIQIDIGDQTLNSRLVVAN